MSTDELPEGLTSPEDFKKFIHRDDNGPVCGICFQFSNRSVTNVRNHIESKHFPASKLHTNMSDPLLLMYLIVKRARDTAVAVPRPFLNPN